MNVVRFMGGLGNQMFQFALLQSFELLYSEAIANLDFYEKCDNCTKRKFMLFDIFPNLKMNVDACGLYDELKLESKIDEGKKIELISYYKEHEASKFDPNVFMLKGCALNGYWQTEKYFKCNRIELLHAFQFIKGDLLFEKFLETIDALECSISVHVRRGDYLIHSNLYGDICTVNYFLKAINIVESRYKNISLVFLSDDIEWVRNNLKFDNAIYVSNNMFINYEDWYDMCIMTHCCANIISNSSFSWWGAWLNNNDNKMVIAPSKWINNASTPDIWCEGWIKV